MSVIDEKKRWVLVIHISLWCVITIAMLMIYGQLIKKPLPVVFAVSIHLIGFLVVVYGNLRYLLPRFYAKKKYWKYGIGLVLILMGTAVFRYYVGYELARNIIPETMSYFQPSLLGSFFFSGTLLLIITTPLYLIENWFKRYELEQELKTHQLEAELRFLKAQVNPHFLFNALNNIYALSFTQSEKAPEMILKLSDMMSYMLYDCKHDEVLLSGEIQYLKNYVSLQQLKKDGELNIDFEVQGNIEGVRIIPMLFIPFFENAFKHGNLEDTEKGYLKCLLKVEKGGIHLQISNSYIPEAKKLPKGGVGLENIKARLALLYPNLHQLQILKKECEFSICLKLNQIQPPNRSTLKAKPS